MQFTQNREFAILTDGKRELIYSLSSYEFIKKDKGMSRVKINDITHCDDNLKPILKVIDITSKTKSIQSGLNKLKDYSWLEILIKSNIQINDLDRAYKTKYIISNINKNGKTLEEIFSISKSIAKYLRRSEKEYHLYEIIELKTAQKHVGDISSLDQLGFEANIENIIENSYNSGYHMIMTQNARTIEYFSTCLMINRLLDMGYTRNGLKKYIEKHIDMYLPNKQDVIMLLYSYVNWHEFIKYDGHYPQYPKNLLERASKCRVDSQNSRISDRYHEIYTDKFDTEHIKMSKTYEEYLKNAKEMKNCLLQSDQNYDWKMLNGSIVIMFGEINVEKACVELKINSEEIQIIQTLGVKNKKLENEHLFVEELVNRKFELNSKRD